MKEYYKSALLNVNDYENSEGDDYDYKSLSNLINKILLSSKTNNMNRKVNGNVQSEYESSDEVNNLQPELDYNLEQRFIEKDLQNPFLIAKNKVSLGNVLSYSSDSDLSESDEYFNTNTRIDALGGLTLWQLTAIIIAILMFIGLSIYFVKRVNTFMKKVYHSNVLHSRLSSSRSSSVRTSYSVDSSNHLISNDHHSHHQNFNHYTSTPKKKVPYFV